MEGESPALLEEESPVRGASLLPRVFVKLPDLKSYDPPPPVLLEDEFPFRLEEVQDDSRHRTGCSEVDCSMGFC